MKFRVEGKGKEVEAPPAAPPSPEPAQEEPIAVAAEVTAPLEERKTRNRVVGSAHTPVLDRAKYMEEALGRLEDDFQALGRVILTWSAQDGMLMLRILGRCVDDRPRYWTTTLQELCFVHGDGLRPAALVKDTAEELLALSNQIREIRWMFRELITTKEKRGKSDLEEEPKIPDPPPEARTSAPVLQPKRRIVPSAAERKAQTEASTPS